MERSRIVPLSYHCLVVSFFGTARFYWMCSCVKATLQRFTSTERSGTIAFLCERGHRKNNKFSSDESCSISSIASKIREDGA